MQPLSFQINQAVLVENDVPYHYDLAKILQRTQNQDQARQYQIKFYKQTHNSQSRLIDAFKIRKINTKLFHYLKEKCQQFPELAQSFRSIDFELSKNQVFIDHQEKDKFWKKLFNKSVLYLQAKKSLRIKYKSIHNEVYQVKDYKNQQKFKNMPLNKDNINLIFQVHISKVKKESNNFSATNHFGKIVNKQIALQSSNKKTIKSKTKTKTQSKLLKNLYSSKIVKQSLLNESYKCLYIFGLNYIASQQEIQKIRSYFLQDSTHCIKDLQKQSQGLQNYLDQLKKIIFSLQFDRNHQGIKISQLQSLLKMKLKHILHSKPIIFPQNITEKVILVIKIYYLKKIQTLKSIIINLKIWLKLFTQKLAKKHEKAEQFNRAHQQFNTQVEQVLNISIFE